MHTIIDAIEGIDTDTVYRLAGETGLVLLGMGSDAPVSQKIMEICTDIVSLIETTPTTAQHRSLTIAMAGLVLGYAIARHEIGEELLGEGGDES